MEGPNEIILLKDDGEACELAIEFVSVSNSTTLENIAEEYHVEPYQVIPRR